MRLFTWLKESELNTLFNEGTLTHDRVTIGMNVTSREYEGFLNEEGILTRATDKVINGRYVTYCGKYAPFVCVATRNTIPCSIDIFKSFTSDTYNIDKECMDSTLIVELEVPIDTTMSVTRAYAGPYVETDVDWIVENSKVMDIDILIWRISLDMVVSTYSMSIVENMMKYDKRWANNSIESVCQYKRIFVGHQNIWLYGDGYKYDDKYSGTIYDELSRVVGVTNPLYDWTLFEVIHICRGSIVDYIKSYRDIKLSMKYRDFAEMAFGGVI